MNLMLAEDDALLADALCAQMRRAGATNFSRVLARLHQRDRIGAKVHIAASGAHFVNKLCACAG